MAFVPNDPLSAGPILGVAQRKKPEHTYSEILGAGLRQESPIVQGYETLTAPKFAPVEEFNVFDALKDDPMGTQYPYELGKAKSQQELDFLKQQLKEREKLRAVLAESGTAGILAGMAGGIFSPTSLIPFAGPARGIKGALQAFALAGAASSIDEMALLEMQPGRTREEALAGIAMGTILMGSLGSLAAHVRPKTFHDLNSDMAHLPGKEAISYTTPDGATTRVEVPTIRAVEAPKLDVNPQTVGSTVTVFDHEGTPHIAKIETTGQTVTVKLDTGELRRVGEDVNVESPVSPTFVITADAAKRAVSIIPDRELVAVSRALDQTVVMKSQRGEPAGQFVAERAAVQAEAKRRMDLRANETVADVQARVEKLAPEEIAPTVQAERDLADIARAWGDRPTVEQPLPKFEERIPDAELVGRDAGGPSQVGAATRDAGAGFNRGLDKGKTLVSRKIIEFLAKLNPLTRALENSRNPALRRAGALFQLPGVKLEGNAQFQPPAPEGTMVARSTVHYAPLGRAIEKLDEAYASYYHGKHVSDRKLIESWTAQIRGGFGMTPEGKLTREQFMHEAFVAANKGTELTDPWMKLAVEAQLDYYKYWDDLATAYHKYRQGIDGEDASPLYRKQDFSDPEEGDLVNYVHHMLSADKIVPIQQEFIADISKHYEGIMNNAFQKGYEKFAAKREQLKTREEALGMSPDELDGALLGVETNIKVINEQYAGALERIKTLRKNMRETGASPAEIKDAVAAEQATLGRDFASAMDTRSRYMRRQKLLREVGGGFSEERQRLLDRVETLEDQQLSELKRVAAAGARFDKQLARVDDQLMDQKLAKIWEDFVRATTKFNEFEAKLDELAASDDLVKLDNAIRRANTGEDKMLAAFKKLESAKGFDREEARQLINDLRDKYLAKAQRLNSSRAVRAEKAQVKAKELDPETKAAWREAEIEKVRKERYEHEDEFDTKWREAGAEDLNLTKGSADFARSSVDEAKRLLNTIVGSPLRVVGMDLVGDARGAQLSRVLQLPFDLKQKYLETDPEKVMRAHTHHMAPDVELYRATGSVNGKKLFAELAEDLERDLERVGAYTHMQGRIVRGRVVGGKPINYDALTPAQKLEVEGKVLPLTASQRADLHAKYWRDRKLMEDDLHVLVDRFRHSRGIPTKPDGFGYRLGQAAKHWNVVRWMGNVLPASIPDLARPIFYAGLTKTFKHGWEPLITDLALVKGSRAEAYRSGIGFEPLLHNRAHAITDLGENFAKGQTAAERGLEFLANKTGTVALFDYWTRENKFIAAQVVYGELSNAMQVFERHALNDVLYSADEIRMAQAALTGNKTGMTPEFRVERMRALEKELQALPSDIEGAAKRVELQSELNVLNEQMWADRVINHPERKVFSAAELKEFENAKELLHAANLGDDIVRRIMEQYRRPGGSTKFDNGFVLPNTEKWDDFDAVMAMRAAVNQTVDNLIVTPGLDRPSWVDANMAFKNLAQFRSFSFTATNRIIMSGAQEADMALVQGAVFSLALGAISYYTWAYARGGKSEEQARNASMEQVIYEALSRSGLLGVFGDVQRVGEQIPLVNDWAIFGGEGRASRRADTLVGAFGGPSFDLAQRVARVVQGMDDPTQSTMHTARTLQFYQNVFWMARGFNAVEEGLNSALGIPEQRQN